MDDPIARALNGGAGETATVQRTSTAIRCQFARARPAIPAMSIAGEASDDNPRMLTATGLDIVRRDTIVRSDMSQWRVETNGVLRQVRNPITGKVIAYMEYTMRSF